MNLESALSKSLNEAIARGAKDIKVEVTGLSWWRLDIRIRIAYLVWKAKREIGKLRVNVTEPILIDGLYGKELRFTLKINHKGAEVKHEG